MSALVFDCSTGSVPTSLLVGPGVKADCVWTRKEFLQICRHMHNGNPQTEVMLVYRDQNGTPKFKKSKTALADRRATWTWDTITGRAKSKVGIGFYPSNQQHMSRWGAMDFDAHDEEGPSRARDLALSALQLLRRNPDLYIVLCTSGSDGWHIFLFTEEFHPIGEWTLMLKQVAALIGVKVQDGLCEIFPSETRAGSPKGIRAPGTWNPKTDAFSLIVWNSLSPLLLRSGEREECPFLYHSTNREKKDQLNDREKIRFYRGQGDEWTPRFAIVQQRTRHAQLKALVFTAFRNAGYDVARMNAAAQYGEATAKPRATLAEHLQEFDELWEWITRQWHGSLSLEEKDGYARLGTDKERDLFRIVQNFARKAMIGGREDFPLPVENVGQRLGVSFQYVSKLRLRFRELCLIAPTAPHVPNRKAARFRWIPQSGDAVIPNDSPLVRDDPMSH